MPSKQFAVLNAFRECAAHVDEPTHVLMSPGTFYRLARDLDEKLSRFVGSPSKPNGIQALLIDGVCAIVCDSIKEGHLVPICVKGDAVMPKGTKVHKCYDKLTKEGMEKGKAARVCQSATGKSLKTGRKPKKK